MKVCAHVWMIVNYLTKPTHTQIRYPLRHTACTPQFYLSVSVRLSLSRSLCLISYSVARLKITRSGQLFSGSKHLSRLAWDQQFHSLLQTWPCLKCILQLDSQGGKDIRCLYLVTLITGWRKQVPWRSPRFSQTQTLGLLYVFWLCIFIYILDI